MKVLNVYLIHSAYLTNRIKYINSTLDMLKKICEKIDIDVKISSVLEPSKEFIDANIDDFNSRVNYDKDKTDVDDQFNNTIKNLNSHQISNTEKHRQAYKHITNPGELHFIIEDDVVVNTDYIENMERCLLLVATSEQRWDIVFTCLASIDDNEEMTFKNSRSQYKFLLSKSSYFIKPDVASKLYEYTQTFKHNLKNSLSKYVWYSDVLSYVINKHTFLEGSKMGIFPSSLCGNNFLYQNINFVNLIKISNSDEITDKMLEEAKAIHSSVSKTESPDFLHSMGIIYYKMKDYKESKRYLLEACESLDKNNGFISQSSEILNNAINMFQYDQDLLEECKKTKSKYGTAS